MLKRILDVLIAGFVFILLLPVFLLIAALIKIDSKGEVFFVQGRLGLNGRVFNMFKFRTMVKDAENMGTGLFSYEDDPRITKVGGILRKFSLDELPQLINVIKGDMSLVGPRPPVTYELGDYKDFSEEMKIRFQMKPGITGLAQVSGRNDLDWGQKIEYDNLYIAKYKKQGLFLDLRILIQTVGVVISSKNVIEKEPEK